MTHETVRPNETQEINQNVVREHEVHHHQHRIQPVEEKRTLPTEHKHEQLATEHRHRETPMAEEDAARHQKMQTGITDQQKVAPTERTTVEGGTNTHHLTHHHIHESIQPVIQRETVQPSVIHTTKNVHEHITDRPIVHDQTVEPTLSINQFKEKVGHLTGGHSTSHHEHMKPNVVPHSGQDTSSSGYGSGISGPGTGTGSSNVSWARGSGMDGETYSSGSGTGSGHHHNPGVTGAGGTMGRNLENDATTAATSYSGEHSSSGVQAKGLTGNGADYTQATTGSKVKDFVGEVTERGQASGTGTTGPGTTGSKGTHSGTGYTR